MRRFFRAILLTVLAWVGSGITVLSAQEIQTKVIAYYFHGTARCSSCMLIERYAKEALAANFPEALAAGKLEFQAINVEESGNEHYSDDYQLYTKSLILSLIQDGREIKSENLTKVWEYLRDKQQFFDYVSEAVNNFLREAQ